MNRTLLEAGVVNEDARYVLPNAAKNNITITMNARELLHFFSLRCCNRAQWEIRELALKMLEKVKKVAPKIFEKAGAACVVLGYCPETESCGRAPPLKEIIGTHRKGKAKRED
ncbi:MAG: FAD-dependent thymidylate synthase [Thermoplasmata archaeon]|nr:FAD-dependent thymidylate synthase [Thermoplasmata archaeon]